MNNNTFLYNYGWQTGYMVWNLTEKWEYMSFTERKTSSLPAAFELKRSYTYNVIFLWHIGGSIYRHLWGQWPTFPTKNPTLTSPFIYICVIILYKLHSSLNNLQAVWRWGSLRDFEIDQVRQKCSSGQQGLNLLRGSGYQIFWVLVAISRAGECCVNLCIGSAHQLCRLAENLLPAQTDRALQTHKVPAENEPFTFQHL